MIVNKLWGEPFQYCNTEGEFSGPWYLEASVTHEDGRGFDTEYELVFMSFTEAYDFWHDFNSVDGGVRWGD